MILYVCVCVNSQLCLFVFCSSDPTALAKTYKEHCGLMRMYTNYARKDDERQSILSRLKADTVMGAELEKLEAQNRDSNLQSDLSRPWQKVLTQ